MVWFGNVFKKKNISKKADVGLVGYIYLSNANFTTDNKKEWLKKKNFKKRSNIYCVIGQTVIPLESQQSISQAASWGMNTQQYVSITSSPTVQRQKESFLAVKFQGWNVQGGTDWRYAPGNLEPFFPPTPSLCLSSLLHF